MGKPPARSFPQREARRLETRRRLCAAANRSFFEQGYSTATMENIAARAGTRRSTLYTHFRDKGELLSAVAENYGDKLCRVLATFPGPTPAFEDIEAHVRRVAEFVASEHTPTILLLDLGSVTEVQPPVRHLGERLLFTLAERLPAFRRAIEPGPERDLEIARAAVVLRELCIASLHHARAPGSAEAEAMLVVVSEMIDRFVRGGIRR